jgi:hypothetical protein
VHRAALFILGRLHEYSVSVCDSRTCVIGFVAGATCGGLVAADRTGGTEVAP